MNSDFQLFILETLKNLHASGSPLDERVKWLHIDLSFWTKERVKANGARSATLNVEVIYYY